MNYENYGHQATVIVNFFSLKQETILLLAAGILYTYLIVIVMQFTNG